MSVRGLMSLCLYHMGDYVCEMTLRKNFEFVWLYTMYGQLMLCSFRLDKHDEVWTNKQDE